MPRWYACRDHRGTPGLCGTLRPEYQDDDTLPTLTAALSSDRFATYLQWTSGDQTLAERLYTYNVQLSAALYGPLHMQEVALRNRAGQTRLWNRASGQTGISSWQ